MKKNSVYDCSIIELDKHHSDRKGNISVIENNDTIPFEAKRVYYLYDVPGGEARGSHAHKELSQLIIAVSGSFSVTLDDG
ncbi:WxcM-like domain-containing protein, partial [Odoribacter laneus]